MTIQEALKENKTKAVYFKYLGPKLGLFKKGEMNEMKEFEIELILDEWFILDKPKKKKVRRPSTTTKGSIDD